MHPTQQNRKNWIQLDTGIAHLHPVLPMSLSFPRQDHRPSHPCRNLSIASIIGILASISIGAPAGAQMGSITGNPLPAPVLPTVTSPTQLPYGVPNGLSPNTGYADSYIVYIVGGDDQTLAWVRQVAPTAFRRFYNGQVVIQTGAFLNTVNAQLGMISGNPGYSNTTVASSTGFGGAQAGSVAVVPLPAQAISPQTLTFTAPQAAVSPIALPVQPAAAIPNASPTVDNRDFSGYYFVIVPGRFNDLTAIANQLQQLGAQPGTFFQRSQPYGPHIAMGPFPDRGAAEEWNRYLRDYGLDARVFYQR